MTPADLHDMALVGTFWLGYQSPRYGTQAVYEVVEVVDYANEGGNVVPMVYARRLDPGNASDHPQGTVRKVAVVNVFVDRYQQITEAEARERAA